MKYSKKINKKHQLNRSKKSIKRKYGGVSQNISSIDDDNLINIISKVGSRHSEKVLNLTDKKIYKNIQTAKRTGYLKVSTLDDIINDIVRINPGIVKDDLVESVETKDKDKNTNNNSCIVSGDINWNNKNIKHLPESIGDLKINGDLNLSRNKIETLPESFSFIKINGDLNLSDNQIKELPTNFEEITIKGFLNLSKNNIRSLPDNFDRAHIEGNIYVINNYLHLPENLNKKLIGWEYIYQKGI